MGTPLLGRYRSELRHHRRASQQSGDRSRNEGSNEATRPARTRPERRIKKGDQLTRVFCVKKVATYRQRAINISIVALIWMAGLWGTGRTVPTSRMIDPATTKLSELLAGYLLSRSRTNRKAPWSTQLSASISGHGKLIHWFMAWNYRIPLK